VRDLIAVEKIKQNYFPNVSVGTVWRFMFYNQIEYKRLPIPELIKHGTYEDRLFDVTELLEQYKGMDLEYQFFKDSVKVKELNGITFYWHTCLDHSIFETDQKYYKIFHKRITDTKYDYWLTDTRPVNPYGWDI